MLPFACCAPRQPGILGMPPEESPVPSSHNRPPPEPRGGRRQASPYRCASASCRLPPLNMHSPRCTTRRTRIAAESGAAPGGWRSLYRGKAGGRGRNRTGVHGFAVRCIATLPPGPWAHTGVRASIRRREPAGSTVLDTVCSSHGRRLAVGRDARYTRQRSMAGGLRMTAELSRDEEVRRALETIFAADSEIYQTRGFQRRIGFGTRPALLIIDLANAWTKPGPQLHLRQHGRHHPRESAASGRRAGKEYSRNLHDDGLSGPDRAALRHRALAHEDPGRDAARRLAGKRRSTSVSRRCRPAASR